MLVQVRVLGSFEVVVDGGTVPAEAWRRRSAAALVKLLALAPDRRLHRDRVIDALWPDLPVDLALPRLHKAAHYARRACGDQDAVVLRGETVALFPGATVEVDALAFEAAAARAVSGGAVSQDELTTALALAAELLPDDIGEPWLDEPRGRLRLRTVDLLRGSRRWEELLRLEPGDEQAHVELLREAVLRRDRAGGLRRYARMEQTLDAELGVPPPPEAVALRESLLATVPAQAGPSPDAAAVAAARRSEPAGLLERDVELDEMSTAVESAIGGGPGVVVLVSGEAGAGKSSVVGALLERLGPAVISHLGGCDDLLAPRSLGPFRDMAVGHPELAPALASEHLDDVLPALLKAFAAPPSVVVVEDVHWADDATLDAIRFLARRLPGTAGALLLTFRDTGIDPEHPLRRLLGGLVGPQVRRIALSPLSVDAVRRLAGAGQADAAEIHRVTQGNAFFVTEVLAAGASGVPATVRDAVLARVTELAPPVRVFVERLAVVPSRAERWLAEALAGNDATVVLAAERSGMVLGGDTWVAFRHELARQAVESSLTAGERVQANRQVVEALLSRPDADSSRLVHHAARSGQVDVVLARGPAAALEAARLGSHRQAAGLWRVVLEHRRQLGALEVADLLTRRAYSLYLVNEFEDALECAEAGVAAAEQGGDAIVLADALQLLARVVLFARGPVRSRVAATRAVSILEAAGDQTRLAAALTELARAYSNLATVGIVADTDEQSQQYAGRALQMARQVRRTDIEATAMCYLGGARLGRGDPRGERDLARAISLAASDSRIETRVRCIVNAAHSAYRGGRPDDAERFVAAGLEACSDGEFFAGRYRLRLVSAAVHGSRGNWDLAVAELREMLGEPGDPGVMAALARSILARLLARRGEHGSANEVLAVALAEHGQSDDSFVAGPVAVAQVELGWLDGSLGELTEDARRALNRAAAAGHRSVQAELTAYLRRAGIDVPAPQDPPGPWALVLAGQVEEAAAAWAALGERYEEAVVLAAAPDGRVRARGQELLQELGAAATLLAV